MSLPRLATAAPVRYALVFALWSSLVMGVLLAVIYWWVSSTLARQLDESIEAQLQVLRAAQQQEGAASVIGLVQQHGENYAHSPIHFLVQDREGRVIAGDLPPTTLGAGWHDLALRMPGDRQMHALRGHGEWLSDDLFVLVTNDTHDLEQTRKRIVLSFIVALAATVALALGGGLVISRVLLRRVEAVNHTARAIMDGDLSRRIPVVGAGDELGGLAESVNAMLARIEELMANLRHMSSDIAHDLRTPLGRLRQRLETLRSRPGDARDQERAIDAAIGETDAVIETFESLLRIAEVEARARRGGFEPVDMAEVVENVADAFAAVAEDQGKRLDARVDGAVVIEGDRPLLTQMLANLIENAIRHTPQGTAVSVRAEARTGGVRLVVSDSGPGIAAEEHEHVFLRFYRGDRSRTTPGSGLGLSLVTAIVRLHGGEVQLEDAHPGLAVVVELDRTREPARPGQAPATAS